MNLIKKIYKIANKLENKNFFKFADDLEKALNETDDSNINVKNFLEITEKMNKITQYKIISLLKMIGCSDDEILKSLKTLRKRYNEIMSNEDNLKDLIYILQGNSYEIGETRRGLRSDIEHAMEIIENWLIEEAIRPYMHRLSGGSEWHLNSFDKDRVLNLSKVLDRGADFIDDDGVQYELKTRWGGKNPIVHIKKTSVPDEDDKYHIYFMDVGSFGKKYQDAMPAVFPGNIYDLSIPEVKKYPLVRRNDWGGREAYQINLSKFNPIKSTKLRADQIYPILRYRLDDWTGGKQFLKRNKIEG